MTFKNQVLFTFLASVAAFAGGRYSMRQPAVTATVKEKEQKQVAKEVHTQTTTTVTKLPTGEVKTTTTTDTVANTQITKKTDTESKISVNLQKNLNISALAGINIPDKTPIYGVSVSKEIVGPFTAGVFGLNNGTAGISIGLNFRR